MSEQHPPGGGPSGAPGSDDPRDGEAPTADSTAAPASQAAPPASDPGEQATSDTGEPDDPRAWIRFAIAFGVLAMGFELLYNGYLLDSHGFHIFLTWLAEGTGLFLEPFYEPVRVSSTRVSIPGFVVDVDYGCDAVQVCTLLISAVVAFPAPFRRKLVGVLLGVPWMQAWNVVRIGTLVIVGRIWGHNAFESMHVYVWPTLLIMISLGSWIFWVRWATHDE